MLRIETVEQLILSPFGSHLFENMVVMEKVKQFAERGEQAPCYFYRTSNGAEVDLLIDHGDSFEAYEVKFSSTPTSEMTKSLALFKEEYPVKKAALLTLRKEKLPFSNGISAEHWNA